MQLADHLQRLEGLKTADSTPADVVFATQSIQALRGFLNQCEMELTRRSITHHDAGQGHPAEELLQRGAKVSQREAARRTKRAAVLGETPEISAALGSGQISNEHADVVANIASRIDNDEQRAALLALDAELADAASSKTPEQFRRHVNRTANELTDDDGVERSERQRQLAKCSMGYDDETGMGWLHLSLHPDDYQSVRRKIDAETAALCKTDEFAGVPRERVTAAAFVSLFHGKRTSAPAPSEVLVLIDLESMMHGAHADTVAEYADGVPLPVETARRHACTADIIPAVLDGAGRPLDVGYGKRLATPAQRHALRSMYRTCALGGCERSFERCEIHHLQEWDDLGPTDLENLVPICAYHHHRAHEGRWRLQLDPSTRELTAWLPDGTLYSRTLPDILTERAARAA